MMCATKGHTSAQLICLVSWTSFHPKEMTVRAPVSPLGEVEVRPHPWMVMLLSAHEEHVQVEATKRQIWVARILRVEGLDLSRRIRMARGISLSQPMKQLTSHFHILRSKERRPLTWMMIF